MLLAWKFKKVTQRSTSNLAEILMSRTSFPVQLQHDAGKFWDIIIFTRNIKLVWDFDVENISLKVQHDACKCWVLHVHKTTLPWASLKIHKGHTKVNVKLVQDFDVEKILINLQHDKAIYEQLLHSQSSGCRLSPICPSAQATTIPLQPKGAEG